MSDNEKNALIKKENRKALKIFIPMVILGGIGGGIFGFFSQTMGIQNLADQIGELVAKILYVASPYGVIIAEVGALLAGLYTYRKAKGLEVQISDDDESEVVYEKIDALLEHSMMAVNMGLIFGFMFFGCVMCYLIRYLEQNRVSVYIAVVVFILSSFLMVRLNQCQVDMLKRLNPDKSGSVYDMKFHEKWEESCDEMEKLIIYRAGYKAYMAVNKACSALWCVFAILSTIFDYGPLPMVIITAIWLVLILSYYKEAVKLEKEKINE